jgi:hypothetical protein
VVEAEAGQDASPEAGADSGVTPVEGCVAYFVTRAKNCPCVTNYNGCMQQVTDAGDWGRWRHLGRAGRARAQTGRASVGQHEACRRDVVVVVRTNAARKNVALQARLPRRRAHLRRARRRVTDTSILRYCPTLERAVALRPVVLPLKRLKVTKIVRASVRLSDDVIDLPAQPVRRCVTV